MVVKNGETFKHGILIRPTKNHTPQKKDKIQV